MLYICNIYSCTLVSPFVLVIDAVCFHAATILNIYICFTGNYDSITSDGSNCYIFLFLFISELVWLQLYLLDFYSIISIQFNSIQSNSSSVPFKSTTRQNYLSLQFFYHFLFLPLPNNLYFFLDIFLGRYQFFCPCSTLTYPTLWWATFFLDLVTAILYP